MRKVFIPFSIFLRESYGRGNGRNILTCEVRAGVGLKVHFGGRMGIGNKCRCIPFVVFSHCHTSSKEVEKKSKRGKTKQISTIKKKSKYIIFISIFFFSFKSIYKREKRDKPKKKINIKMESWTQNDSLPFWRRRSIMLVIFCCEWHFCFRRSWCCWLLVLVLLA